MQGEVTFHCMGQCPFEILQVKPTNPCCQSSTKYKLTGRQHPKLSEIPWNIPALGGWAPRTDGYVVIGSTPRLQARPWGKGVPQRWPCGVTTYPPRPRMILQANLPNFSSQKPHRSYCNWKRWKSWGKKKMASRWFEVHPWKINGWNPKSWRWMVAGDFPDVNWMIFECQLLILRGVTFSSPTLEKSRFKRLWFRVEFSPSQKGHKIAELPGGAMEISHKNWQDFRSRPAKHGPWGSELEISQVLLIASQEIPAAWGIFTLKIAWIFSKRRHKKFP